MLKFGTRKTAAAALFILTGASAAMAGQPPDPTASDSYGNTAAGTSVLVNVQTGPTTGSANTAIGFNALLTNTTGNGNTASGYETLLFNSTGFYNTASGYDALSRNITGSDNTAIGAFALFLNSGGVYNTAIGASALSGNTGGYNNTASGATALYSNTTGTNNTADGVGALYNNTTGGNNTALGYAALYSNTTGLGNIALGNVAGVNIVTGSNNIDIANPGQYDESNTIRLGQFQTSAFIAGIRGTQTGLGNAVAVYIDGNGQLGTLSSSARFKEDIRDMAGYSRGILDLRPVTYHYKEPPADDAKPLESGLIAEEVAKIYPDLVTYDRDGQLETVQYHKLTPMLLNELQRQQRTLDAQAKQLAGVKAENQALRAAVAELKAELHETLAALIRGSARP